MPCQGLQKDQGWEACSDVGKLCQEYIGEIWETFLREKPQNSVRSDNFGIGQVTLHF